MSTPEHYWEDLRLKKVQVSNGEHCCKLLVITTRMAESEDQDLHTLGVGVGGGEGRGEV